MTPTTPSDLRACVFISGAAAGIGRATARLFAARGWFVGAGDVDAAGLAALAQELGDAVMTLPLDVTQPADWDTALAAFHARTGRLDVLVNNAGILISGPFEASPLARHQAQLAVNAGGVLNGCHAAHRYLAATPGARVINLASSAALYGQASLAGYSATKFFVRGLTEALNIEWQPQGIRVFDLLPLFVRTAMVQDMNARSIRRLGVRLTPEDVAAVIWKAAHYTGWRKVHWTVGLQAAVLYRLGDITPGWINRAVARRIA
ncbi:SDR family oxidoreductase [Ottowia testudinis]|uniref:SDR family oxidoreductase n=1 Tax=Ottowia testudinis TaxID=2816950 RepID=A0A975H4E2_9BURK|nr:SDR family oxidoreductase [Ottowia testudinis]QTD46275.1 SDR family oxidoreductase [Ottowia testudinis]